MKAQSTRIYALVFSTLLAAASMASAQTTSETTTTTSTTSSDGTISDFSPTVFTVRADPVATPVTYSYSKTTTYVDENGNPVSVETVRSGVPVTVYYTRDGTGMVASKVVVHKVVTPDPASSAVVEKKTTTTTTTSGN